MEHEDRARQALQVTLDAKLAEQGKCRCRVCKQVKDIKECLLVTWRSNMLYAICASDDCLPKQPLVIRREMTSRGMAVYVGPLTQMARSCPANVLVASDMSQVDHLVAKDAVPKFKKG